jgi:hypothetical protein
MAFADAVLRLLATGVPTRDSMAQAPARMAPTTEPIHAWPSIAWSSVRSTQRIGAGLSSSLDTGVDDRTYPVHGDGVAQRCPAISSSQYSELER